jgi:hypothetical protein
MEWRRGDEVWLVDAEARARLPPRPWKKESGER